MRVAGMLPGDIDIYFARLEALRAAATELGLDPAELDDEHPLAS